MKINRYCIVIELKEEHVEEYKEIHKNAWLGMLNAIKTAGAKELLIWIYKNFSIIYYECDDINKFYKELGKFNTAKKWNKTVNPWFKESPILDGSGNITTLEKIFDLNQESIGRLEQY